MILVSNKSKKVYKNREELECISAAKTYSLRLRDYIEYSPKV